MWASLLSLLLSILFCLRSKSSILAAIFLLVTLRRFYRYQTQKDVATGASRPRSGMMSEAASGIGNPVYSMYGAEDGGTGGMDNIDDVSFV